MVRDLRALKPVADGSCRNASNDRISIDIFRDDRTGGDDGASPDPQFGQDDRPITYPDVVFNDDGVRLRIVFVASVTYTRGKASYCCT